MDYVPPPTAAERAVPQRFRLPKHSFDYRAQSLGVAEANFEVWDVTFPSPVVTPHEANNTVHCEYYAPRVAGKRPAVIVLHILGGDFALSRLFCNALAQKGTAALFVKMPYYGPRRVPGSKLRMVSPDAEATVAGMTQAVLDIRRAAAWLAARDEVDAQNLGIFGISLGGITAALATTAEPRLKHVCLLLAGGDLETITKESSEFDRHRQKWIAEGGDTETALTTIRTIDPLQYATNARGRRILMLNAKEDTVIPRSCTLALWEGFGRPPIHWFEGDHYSVIRHLFKALHDVSDFFAAAPVRGPGVAE